MHAQSMTNITLTSSANFASFAVLSLTCSLSSSTHFVASTSLAIWDGVHNSLSSQLASAPRESNILRNNNIVLFIHYNQRLMQFVHMGHMLQCDTIMHEVLNKVLFKVLKKV